MSPILITGFTPFDGNPINSSQETIKRLPDEINGIDIKKLIVPTIFNQSAKIVIEAVRQIDPSYIILLGQAGRNEISLERVAININDTSIADNIGNFPVDEMIIPDGENAYFSTLPNRKIIAQLNSHHIPVNISNTAGTFVCNNLFYNMLYFLKKNSKYQHIPCGFIHLPWIKEQKKLQPVANISYWELDKIVKAVELMLHTLIDFT